MAASGADGRFGNGQPDNQRGTGSAVCRPDSHGGLLGFPGGESPPVRLTGRPTVRVSCWASVGSLPPCSRLGCLPAEGPEVANRTAGRLGSWGTPGGQSVRWIAGWTPPGPASQVATQTAKRAAVERRGWAPRGCQPAGSPADKQLGKRPATTRWRLEGRRFVGWRHSSTSVAAWLLRLSLVSSAWSARVLRASGGALLGPTRLDLMRVGAMTTLPVTSRSGVERVEVSGA